MMRFDWKKALRAVAMAAVLMAVLGGLGWFLFLIILLTGVLPVYAVWALAAVYAAGLLALILLNSDYLGPRGRRAVGRCMLCVCAGAAIYAAWGAWNDSIPTLDDRSLLLEQYEPFAENTLAARLDSPASLRFDDFTARRLKLDGATALYPVYAAFVQAVYPEGDYALYPRGGSDSPYAGVVRCTNTVNAYDRLVQREADVIFAAAPSADQLAQAEEAGIELYFTPIGQEAFVFFVNSRNPVTGLTVEEIRGIYSGSITNWSQVGGENRSIRPFQRAANSGSQSALERLMDGLPLLEPEQEDRISAMDGIIQQVASYRNYQNAIGFSFRYYATEMVTSEEIRLLALDGVVPTPETIRDGTYPLSSCFYAVTAAPAGLPDPRETDPELDAFLDWICGPEGQLLVERTGYVSLPVG